MFVQEMTKVMFDRPFHHQQPHDQLHHLRLDQQDHLGQHDHLERHNDPALHQRLLLCHVLLLLGTNLCCIINIMNFYNILPVHLRNIIICLILQTFRTTTQAPNPCYPRVTDPPPCPYATTEHPDIAEWRRTRNRNRRPSYQSDQNQVCQISLVQHS